MNPNERLDCSDMNGEEDYMKEAYDRIDEIRSVIKIQHNLCEHARITLFDASITIARLAGCLEGTVGEANRRIDKLEAANRVLEQKK